MTSVDDTQSAQAVLIRAKRQVYIYKKFKKRLTDNRIRIGLFHMIYISFSFIRIGFVITIVNIIIDIYPLF